MPSPSIGAVEDPYSARFHLCPPGRNPGGNQPIEGLWMSRPFTHEPVMVDEIVEIFAAVPPGAVVDATVGGGGHAQALLRRHPDLTIVGLDRDRDALAAAAAVLAPWAERVSLHHARFDELGGVVEGLGLARISGALFDLGVSSPQLDLPERGFSYHYDAPLDMRMDQTQDRTAADVVNRWTERELTTILRANGEGRFATRIARAIIAHRPIATTAELAGIVRDAIPAAARRTGGHPARRTFQAVRIAVNNELDVLPGALDQAIGLLTAGGRAAVLAYHSGEDRIVKDRFRWAETGGCQCPPGLPCVCGAVPLVKPVFRGARRPNPAEIERNRRAESARLRAVERLEPAGSGGER